MESRNFAILINKELKQSFYWDYELEELPADTIAFKYCKDNGEEREMKDFITGVPVKANMKDMTLEMVADPYTYVPNMVCLYNDGEQEMLFTMTPNTEVVNDFNELKEKYSSLTNAKVK